MHRHSFFEPCIVVAGTGEFEHGSAVYALREGDLFIADPGVYHEIRSLATRDLALYFFAFNVIRASATARSREQRGLSHDAIADFVLEHSVHLPGQWHLMSLFEHATKLSHHQLGGLPSRFYTDAAVLLVNQIAAALAQSTRLAAEDHGERALTTRVIAVIEQRLHQRLPVAMLARECGMSERTLRRRWKQCSGRSLTDEITQRRIARASHLLLLPDISVAEAGDQVGIESAAQFSRLFRSVRAVTPREYRRRYLAQPPGKSSGGPPFRTEFLDGDSREYDV